MHFQWRWSIVFTGVLLVMADRAWFEALHQPEALVSLLTLIRRSSVALSFFAGIFFFREKISGPKLISLLIILTGLALMLLL